MFPKYDLGGIRHEKEFLGDDIRPIAPDDIKRAGYLMYTASALMLIIGVMIRTGVILYAYK